MLVTCLPVRFPGLAPGRFLSNYHRLLSRRTNMSTNHETGYLRVFGWVLGCLVAFTFFIAAMANAFSPDSLSENDPLVVEQTKSRILPVGASRVAQ